VESDADRLAMLRGLGGVTVSSPRGTFLAIFDTEYVIDGDIGVETAQPQLSARSSDVSRLELRNGVLVQVGADGYIIRSVQPDGMGMTVLRLEQP
jgi:hypothetical protein